MYIAPSIVTTQKMLKSVVKRKCFLQDDLPEVLKNKKLFARLTTDWNNARLRSQTSTAPQAKQDGLREEVEEAWRKLESIKVSAFPPPSEAFCRLFLTFPPFPAGPVLCRPLSLCYQRRRLR